MLSKTGVLTVDAVPVNRFDALPLSALKFNPECDPPPPNCVAVFLDARPTPSSLFTRTKTTERTSYDSARTRFNVQSLSTDVLLYNEDCLVTETSTFNIAFHRNCRWVTPHESTGCLAGVFRRYLLQEGFITVAAADPITRDTVVEGEYVLLFNAVRGCRLGKIVVKS